MKPFRLCAHKMKFSSQALIEQVFMLKSFHIHGVKENSRIASSRGWVEAMKRRPCSVVLSLQGGSRFLSGIWSRLSPAVSC